MCLGQEETQYGMKLKYQSFSLTKLSCLFEFVEADLLHYKSVRKLT